MALFGLVGGCARPAEVAVERYVALGDSYSSGVGAGAYDKSSGRCMRSGNAYPQLWARSRQVGAFAFVACSGATTGSVSAGQLGALNAATTLVTITVGGNDAGFGRVMRACVLESTAACVKEAGAAEIFMETVLPKRLDGLYGEISTRAPGARVVVLGYPHLYMNVDYCPGVSTTRRNALNKASDTLATVVGAAAVRSGFVFSDVRDEFTGHELCSGDGWLNGTTVPLGDSFHPTARGHQWGYLPAMESALGVRNADQR
ncbi:SGNH/GDSL hydrolase family protein [Actinomadura kijaniata]|uniref:SGNH/GDSL hydrolase family protein n=1 Tax=Actinomadura kijaniata TaxID=46161 RepID=UPI003F1D2ECA